MAGQFAGRDLIIASASNNTQIHDQADLSQRVQALALQIAKPAQPMAPDQVAAPASKWDKFVDVTEQGIKHIPDGMWNAVKHPLGLIENAAISVGTGIATKILMPESGPLGALFGVGLGLYFTEQTVVPVYNAYKIGMNAKTMGDINFAGSQLGDAVGGIAVNVPVGIASYKLGARLGTEIMATPKMAAFVQWKAATLNPINNAIAAGIDTGLSAARDGIASVVGRLRGTSEFQASEMNAGEMRVTKLNAAEIDEVMTHKFEPRALRAMSSDMNYDDLIHVPLVRQAKGYTCGVASLASILQHYGEEYREDYLARMCHSNNTDGTLYRNIEKFAKSKGYDVDVNKNWTLDALKESIDQKKPPMLMIQAWPEKPVLDFTKDWNDGHFVVAIGYDAKNMYFMDPATTGNYTYIPIPEFLTRWHDVDGHTRLRNFGMVISKGQPNFNYREIKPLE